MEVTTLGVQRESPETFLWNTNKTMGNIIGGNCSDIVGKPQVHELYYILRTGIAYDKPHGK